MMRQPSTFSELYRWHNAAMAGKNPPVHDGEPQAGYYKRKLVRGGPWVPARIFIEREIDPETGELASDEVLCIEVDGTRRRDPAYHWTYLTPISRQEFQALTEEHKTNAIMQATHARIDLSEHAILPRRKAYA